MNNAQPHHTGGFDRDRDRDMEEQRQRALQQDEMARRDREREREEPQRQNREYAPGGPHHSSAGSIPIHQPVASRITNTIHSPGGLLANHGGAAPPLPLTGPQGPQGPPASFGGPLLGEGGRPAQLPGPGAGSTMFAPMAHGPGGPGGPIPTSNAHPHVFGGSLQQDKARGMQQDGGRGLAQQQQVPGLPFNTALGPGHPMPGGPAAISQGQQPILNDALSYLDQVKVQFHEQPDVYNKFLDIMKDFKSQTIDTPGVISRVSDLFAGHPNLIQGFNTFLPPGYRIECGLENNPNSIRVTTPSGSTIHSIGGGRPVQMDTAQPRPGSVPQFGAPRPGNWPAAVQHSLESPEATFAAPVQNAGFPASNQGTTFDGSSPNLPRSVPAVVNGAPPAASHGPPPRNAITPTPTNGAAGLSAAAQQVNMEKRGPVEFNHAISYVNKIKNRFQDKPEIYKQFLEILQTYQREQKPIQEVYAQVTTLFNAAPDLLEDFKQFLPESAAQTNNRTALRIEEGMAISAVMTTPQPAHTVREGGAKMPQVGNFAPPSASKESKKRPRVEKTPAPGTTESGMRTTLSGAQPGPPGKRAKLTHKPSPPGGVYVEPTLTPVMPEPLGPTPAALSTQDHLAHFDRLKKHLGNRTAMIEFLKLLNLYSLDLITQEVLLYKANNFIGGNLELLNWLKGLFQEAVEDELVENRPEAPTGRVSLSHCRGFGPSYRLLPKREKLKPCSGRDELCRSVLNDEWASHPTWASEDSGFVAHRKNGYEEGLHRIEEERHDYDFYIEANQKCIQLLEPISQQMLAMTNAAERAAFKLPVGLGGQSTSIYKRVLKKMYGPEKGAEVANEMFKNPFSVVPIVMARLKQKDEEWRFTQREWEKVWQAQTEAMHLKSLDHMGIQVKSNDKRNLAAKHLVDMIRTKYEEQRRMRIAKVKTPRYQYQYHFDDQDLVVDLLRLMILFATVGGQHNHQERRRIIEFFETFIPQFFDVSEEAVRERIEDIDQDSAEEDEEDNVPAELTNGRARRNGNGNGNGKKPGLLRGVLDRGRNGSRTRPQDSGGSGSKETTPDVTSANEEEMPDAPDDCVPDVSNNRWLPNVPGPIIVEKNRGREADLVDVDGNLKADAPFSRSWYNFYCNQNIYIFFTVFHTLYKRLQDVKNSQDSVADEIKRSKAQKPAKILGFVQQDNTYFVDENRETFWPKTLELMEDFINGEVDEARYQDVLRHYYLAKGWTLYTLQDLLKTLCRVGLSCNNPDTKGEKTKELVKAYLESRQEEETSYHKEINARKFAEKCIKDGEMFVISWIPTKKEATVRWLHKDETTFYTDEMERIQQWQYYISSYMRVEPTEGIVRSRLQKPLLQRNLPSDATSTTASDDDFVPKPVVHHEGLVCRICLNSSKMVFEKNTSDSFLFDSFHQQNQRRGRNQESSSGHSTQAADGVADAAAGSVSLAPSPLSDAEAEASATDGAATVERVLTEQKALQSHLRDQRLRERLVTHNAWMKDVTQEEVQAMKDWYQRLKDGEAVQETPLVG